MFWNVKNVYNEKRHDYPNCKLTKENRKKNIDLRVTVQLKALHTYLF